MRDWDVQSAKIRCGGNISDAFQYLAAAPPLYQQKRLSETFTPQDAHKELGLPSGLRVNWDVEACTPRTFNEDASAGPTLASVGIKTKAGCRNKLASHLDVTA